MPQIQLYQQQTSAGPGFQGATATPEDMGAQVGQGVQRLGAGGEQVAIAGRYGQIAQDERAAKAWTAPAVTGAALDWDKEYNDRAAKALPGDPDITPGVLTDFKAYSDNLIASAPDALSKQYITQHMGALAEQIGKRSIAFDAANRVSGYVDNQLKAIDNSAKLVQQNPDQYGNMLTVIQQTMPDVGPEKRTKLLNSAITSLTSAAAQHYLDGASATP